MALMPIVYSVRNGAIASIPLQSVIQGTNFTVATELFLTIIISLYAAIILLKMRFTWIEALTLFILWLIQFLWVSARPAIVIIYLTLIMIQWIWHRKEMSEAVKGFKHIYKTHVQIK